MVQMTMDLSESLLPNWLQYIGMFYLKLSWEHKFLIWKLQKCVNSSAIRSHILIRVCVKRTPGLPVVFLVLLQNIIRESLGILQRILLHINPNKAYLDHINH